MISIALNVPASQVKSEEDESADVDLYFCKYCLKGRLMSLFEMGTFWTGEETFTVKNDIKGGPILIPIITSRR